MVRASNSTESHAADRRIQCLVAPATDAYFSTAALRSFLDPLVTNAVKTFRAFASSSSSMSASEDESSSDDSSTAEALTCGTGSTAGVIAGVRETV